MDIYSRQQPLDLWVPPAAAVIGCGGVGAWVAIFLAMSGCRKLVLVDPDMLEETNLNRLPFSRDDVGRPKVEVLAGFVTGCRPEASVLALPVAVEPDTGVLEQAIDLLGENGIVFDCTDRIKIQSYIAEVCKTHGVKRIRAGYDGTHLTVTEKPPAGWGDLEGDGYQVVPSWAVPSAVAAALAVAKAERGVPDVSCDIADMCREV